VRGRQAVTKSLFAKIFRNHRITVSDSKIACQRSSNPGYRAGGKATWCKSSGKDTVPES